MKKTVHFDKYCPYTLRKNEDGSSVENKLSLNKLFETIQQSPNGESLQEVLGEKYRIQVCKFHSQEKVWELQILHLRNAVLPGIADEEDTFESLQIPEGKYPAEYCTALYSLEDNTIFLQRNIVCMSAKRFAFYIKKMLPEETKIILKPVISGKRIEKLSDTAKYRKVVLVCALDPKKESNEKKRLSKLLSGYGSYQGLVANISIGMGRKRGNLNSHEVYELIEEAYNESDIQTLKVQYDSCGIGTYEWLDLMLDRESYNITFDYTPQSPLEHNQLFDACLEKFKHEKGKE